MASLQQEPTGKFHISFRVKGNRYKRSLETNSESEAVARKEEIDETLQLIKRNKISVPDDVPIADFILNNGDIPSEPPTPVAKKILTLSSLCKQYFDNLPEGSIESVTLRMMKTHERHLRRILKPKFDVSNLSGKHLQQYINTRAKERTQYFENDASNSEEKRIRKKVSATTIRKELVTFGSIWKWARTTSILSGIFPNGGLRFPKTDEKPPFQTWDEIEQQIEIGQLNSFEAIPLWECLFLKASEINELLEYVKQSANFPFIHPMFAMAAFTGARRAELIRSQRIDFDFKNSFVTLRERKRVRGTRSTRRVPICKQLHKIMTDWFSLAECGTKETFSHINRKQELTGITPDQAHSHFQHTLSGSKWSNIKGWHCLRHSFISNLACSGIDQRIIDDFAGHTTEEMRRRYRHLFPDVKQAAINQVFG